MKQIITKLIALLMLSQLACIEGSISVNNPPDPPKQTEPAKKISLRVFQNNPPPKNLKWGVQLKAPTASILKSDQAGHIISDGEIFITVMRASETQLQSAKISNDPIHGQYPKQSLVKLGSQYFSWLPLPGDIYRFNCRGQVTKEICQEILDSLQIIKR